MKSLAIQLLYKEPPAAVHAMRLGRSNKSLVVQKYKALKEAAEELVEVFETGLHIHSTVGILTASPDRLVNDSSCSPSDGLLEVKYLASVEGPPENAIHGKSNYCLEQSEAGRVQLKRSHNYYYQVQGQMGCTDRMWCDFVAMSRTGETFSKRIYFDNTFWDTCVTKLTHFYRQFFSRELVHPKQSE